MGQDPNHNTLKQHPYDYKLSVGLDRGDTRETPWKHTDVSLEATGLAFCVNRLYSSGASLYVNDQWRESWQTAAAVLIWDLCVKGAYL